MKIRLRRRRFSRSSKSSITNSSPCRDWIRSNWVLFLLTYLILIQATRFASFLVAFFCIYHSDNQTCRGEKQICCLPGRTKARPYNILIINYITASQMPNNRATAPHNRIVRCRLTAPKALPFPLHFFQTKCQNVWKISFLVILLQPTNLNKRQFVTNCDKKFINS